MQENNRALVTARLNNHIWRNVIASVMLPAVNQRFGTSSRHKHIRDGWCDVLKNLPSRQRLRAAY